VQREVAEEWGSERDARTDNSVKKTQEKKSGGGGNPIALDRQKTLKLRERMHNSVSGVSEERKQDYTRATTHEVNSPLIQSIGREQSGQGRA